MKTDVGLCWLPVVPRNVPVCALYYTGWHKSLDDACITRSKALHLPVAVPCSPSVLSLICILSPSNTV
jgi:hypothetical protein